MSNRICYLSNSNFFFRPLGNLFNLKYLRIKNFLSSLKFSDLNKFSRLKVLGADNIIVESDDHLKLDYIKTLSIKYYEIFLRDEVSDKEKEYIVDETIAYKYPNSIKYLRLDFLND